MKKLILIGTAITLFAFSSSAFAQYDDGTLSCNEWCMEFCQKGAGQYQRTGCVMQCPGNCMLRRYEHKIKRGMNCPNPGDCPKGSCNPRGKAHACDMKSCSPNNCAGGARQSAKR
jgi:hypothetical protein